MNMKLFKQHLAKNQKLTEAVADSRTHLKNTNKFLDLTTNSLATAIGHLESYLEVAKERQELSPQEKREIVASIDELEKFLNLMTKAADKVPAA